MENLEMNDQDIKEIGEGSEINSTFSNRRCNLGASSAYEIGTSDNRNNNTIPLYTRLQNNSTYFPEVQAHNESDIYFPAVCLIPVRCFDASNITLFPQQDIASYNSLTAGNFEQNNLRGLPLENTPPLSPYFNSSLNRMPYLQENEGLLSPGNCISSPSDAQNNAVYKLEDLPLCETPLTTHIGQDTTQNSTGSSGNKTATSSYSFDDVLTFPILDAPADCVWPSNEAAINQSALYSSGISNCNRSSFEEIAFGEELSTRPNSTNAQTLPLHSEASEIFLSDYPVLNDLLRRLARATNIEENTFALQTPSQQISTTNQTHWSSGTADPTSSSSNLNYFYFAENTRKPVKPLFCKFCFKNKEPAYLYNSHRLKDENGITVTCPVLRNYVCPICGISGDFAHTIKYCHANPKNKYNQMHLPESPATSLNVTEPSHSTPNNSSTKLPPFSCFQNIKKQPISSEVTQPYSNFPEQLSSQPCVLNNEEVSRQNSYICKCSNSNTSISKSPITYDRFTCAFPTANVFKRKKTVCKFCFRNKELPKIYNSHQLRNDTGRIECPFLRQFVCRICGATGDNAHTRKYCPENTYEEFIEKFTHQ